MTNINKNTADLLSKKFGSPFFLADENKIKINIEKFRKSFSSYKGKFSLGYSVKTNPLIGILKIMKKYDVVAECASEIDIESSTSSGYDQKELVYAGLYKSKNSLESAVKNGIKIINIESLQEAKNIYEILKEYKKKIKVGIRISYPSSTGIKSLLGVTYDRFGNSQKTGDAYRLADYLAERQDSFELLGLHCHPGSNIKNSKKYKISIDKLKKLYDYLKLNHNITIKLINIGGGIGVKEVHFFSLVDYVISSFFKIFGKTYEFDKENFDYTKILREISIYLNDKFSKEKEYPEIMMEPGRALIGNAIDICSSVVVKKKTESGDWLITDAGTNILSILTLLTEQHKIYSTSESSKKIKYSIAGPLLYSSDIIARNVKLNESQIDDHIVISDVGAYFGSQSSSFLFPRCANILRTSNNEFKLIERKESIDDVLFRSKNI